MLTVLKETIITVLPEPTHVKSVFQGILSRELPKTSAQERLFIDCSTIDPSSSREVAAAVHARGYTCGFGISLMKKDLKLAMTAAKEAGAKLELGERAREVYERAEQDENCKGKDFSVVYRYIGGNE